ncbi:MAG: ABC transporter ATP-binding protein [Phycisphaeraceae bacterium]|nr:ABC transporter ATP-binding protein [Phycisphaeraceae bacterium]MCW5753138.1 ABC transporter ATP-binding protein [Phycisphaeraceae bacterium]
MNTPALHIQGLRFRYSPGEWIIDIPELMLASGEQMLLTGASGSGKSTLLQLIAGLLEPQEGTIRIGGNDIFAVRSAARDRLRGKSLGMVFQTFNLLVGFSAMENVLAALMFSSIPRREHDARARTLLDRLDIIRRDARVEELSIGQQQRVAVARALACRPALVLADEPTASLDPANAAGAMDLMQDLCREQEAALLCVSHDPALTARFTRRDSLAAFGRPAPV